MEIDNGKTYITYRDKLSQLGINELCMFKRLEKSFPNDDGINNLCDIAYRKAQRDYFK